MHIMYFNNIWYRSPLLSSLSSALEQFLTPTYFFPVVFHNSSLFYFMRVRVCCMLVCLQYEYRVCCSSDGKVPWQSGAKGCHKHTRHNKLHTRHLLERKNSRQVTASAWAKSNRRQNIYMAFPVVEGGGWDGVFQGKASCLGQGLMGFQVLSFSSLLCRVGSGFNC